MPEAGERLTHLLVLDRIDNREFTRQGRGDQRVREVERRTHGRAIQGQLSDAFTDQDRLREEYSLEELEALGVVVTIEGERGFPLKLESLEQLSRHREAPRPKWLLLGVSVATEDSPERATVWVSDEYRAHFLVLFEDFLSKEYGSGDKPRNQALVANIARIRATVLGDLWQSAGAPPMTGKHWWEIWLRPTPDAVELMRRYAETYALRTAKSHMQFHSRYVTWLEATWDDLLPMPFTAVPIAELRRPQFVDTIEDLELGEITELVDDLAGRIDPAPDTGPAVCLLDTGVRRTHALLDFSLAAQDMHSVVGDPSGDIHGHGTLMAGLALFGALDNALSSSGPLRLRHRLESVKFLPDTGAPQHDPRAYGVVTAQAVALPEVTSDRARSICIAVSAEADRPGEPSLWSAAVDALAVGTDIGASPNGVELLGPPDPSAARLILVSAGNVNQYEQDYLQNCDLSPIEDPAQAWNVLTVGAYTEMDQTPRDPGYSGWTPLGTPGDISPHSRTGVTAGGPQWPIKPDICMEGGNVLTDGAGDFHQSHPVLSLRTTTNTSNTSVGSANATSAATAQAARLAALTMATYPSYWPETVRGLLTHHAEWTPAMRQAIDAEASKKRRRILLTRYGWGIPNEQAVLSSTNQAVTMVVQDEFVPFTGNDYRMRHFRLHQLPWPAEVLEDLGAADVELRVTLSYFIEPSAARRGWRRRFAYASHGLRFEVRAPDETTPDFVRRVNREAAVEEDQGMGSPSSGSDNWLVGPDQRNKGSLHQDVWAGYGAQLARTGGVIAVNAVGGWWKNNRRKDRIDLPIRYALVVSLRTNAEGADIYTPIANTLSIPIEVVEIEI